MRCKYCSSVDSKVIDTRPSEDGTSLAADANVTYAARDLRRTRRSRSFR